MASMRMLVFVTLLFCLFKVGYTSRPPKIISSSRETIEAGFYSRATLWHGVKARFGIWEVPDVKPSSSSGSYIAAINESPELEIIAAGFHVNPSLYGDNKLHFFTYWTSTKDYSTGCYNNKCPGFIVADGNNLYPGKSIDPPFSTYSLEEIRIILRIKKDERTGDWSLYREDKGGPIGDMTLLGWWPKTLFKSLSSHAETIEWIGFVTQDNVDGIGPSMGSGHFANELNNRAASFSDCFGFDKDGNGFEGKDYKPVGNIDIPACYSVSEWYHTDHSAQRHFFYGGPAGCIRLY